LLCAAAFAADCRHTPELNLLVAFGGYNGKYHNAVSVYKLPGYQQHVRSPVKQQQQQQQAKPATPQQQRQQEQQSLQQQQSDDEQEEQQQQLEAQEAAAAAAGRSSLQLPNGAATMVSSIPVN
jgi:membrane protein involved in colicin uptake